VDIDASHFFVQRLTSNVSQETLDFEC